MRRALFALVAVAGLVLGPAVAASAAPSSFSGGTGIIQVGSGNWAMRVTQQAGILAIDENYAAQGYRYITHSADALIEIQLGNHGGAYQGDCLTWNDGLTEFDAIPCAWKVSQEFNFVNEDPPDAQTEFQSWYNKGCMQANDAEGEGSAIQTRPCGQPNVTNWNWDAIYSD